MARNVSDQNEISDLCPDLLTRHLRSTDSQAVTIFGQSLRARKLDLAPISALKLHAATTIHLLHTILVVIIAIAITPNIKSNSKCLSTRPISSGFRRERGPADAELSPAPP